MLRVGHDDKGDEDIKVRWWHGLGWQRFFKVMRFTRWFVLAAFAVSVILLYRWSKEFDPRFYYFLGTEPGQWISKMMNWSTIHNLPPTDVPDEKLKASELLLKEQLQRELNRTWPQKIVRLKNRSTMYGRIAEITDEGVWFQDAYSLGGRSRTHIRNSQVAELIDVTSPVPTVTYRDVRFKLEYPEFKLFFRKNFTVLTDAGFVHVGESVEALEELHGQFVELFRPVIQHPSRGRGIQLLFFSDEDSYRVHQERYAPSMENSSGYYSPLQDRLVVFNHSFSTRVTEVQAQVTQQIHDMKMRAITPESRERVALLEAKIEEQIAYRAKLETYSTVRHEGSHHLFYTYGVLSPYHAENPWLVEGLAVYMEPKEPGGLPVAYLGTLMNMRVEKRWPTLRTLVNTRSEDMMDSFEPEFASYEAYAAAWSLVHYLMQDSRRAKFFDYLRTIRDPASLNDRLLEERAEVLADHMGMHVEDLEKDWLRHVDKIQGL